MHPYSLDTSQFSDGGHEIMLKLRDDPGVHSRAAYAIMDNTGPEITLPAEEIGPVLEVAGLNGTSFSFHPDCTDKLGPAPETSISPDLETYPLGTTPVTFTATDSAGNQTELQTTVTVVDTQPLTLVVPDNRQLEAPANTDSSVTGLPLARDLGDPDVFVTYTDTHETAINNGRILGS